MSRVGTWSPSPRDEYRDRADLGRVTKAASPAMVTTLLSNCLISAHILHACCRQGYVLTNYSLKGFYTSSQHPCLICYMLTFNNLKNPQLASKLALYIEGIDGPLWITKPAEDMQAVEASYSYRGQDSTLTLTSRPAQAGLRSTHGNIALTTMLSQLPQTLAKGLTLTARGHNSMLTLSRSTQAGLRSSLGNIALPTLLSQLRQELKKGPALICITVYRHVGMYAGLTLKGQNRTAALTDIATQAIKPSGHSTALTLAFKIGAVRFLRSFSKLGWDLQQVFLTISKSKLIRVAPGEPFLPFPREGVG